nr:TRAP transporter large permease subunit [Sneathiella glossodoripedis]
MSTGAIGIYGVIATLLLMGLRVPIAVALGSVSIIGIIWMLDLRAGLGIISSVPFNFIGNWALTAVPMFLLMGFICTTTGMTNGLFNAMRIFLQNCRGDWR